MTTIDESLTAKGYTPAALVPPAFGARRTIDEIVIHHWGLPGQSHDGVVNFFVNGPGQTSAHYVVSAGRIHCLVAPEDAAWHCPGKNATTIGIECRPEATEADYATVAELIRTLRAQYGNLPLSKHRDWYNTACPGIWDLSRLDALAAGSTITLQSETITPLEEDDMPSIEEIFDYPIARRGGSLGGETNLRSVIAYFDANVEGTRNIVKESAGAAVAAIFTTELARQGGPGGVTTLAATLAYLDANLNKLDADQILDPEAVRAAVTAATDAALKDISITLTAKES